MRLVMPVFVTMFLIFSFNLTFAQEFEFEPDSLDGVGVRNELHEFDSRITNLWDQQNRILWFAETDIPDDWTLEICQGTLLCWPPWVFSDTLTLEAEAFDTLLVKFRTGDEDAVGTTTIHLTALADTSIFQSYTFTLTVGEVSVDDSPRPSADGRRFQFKSNFNSNGSLITLPKSSFGAITMYDMQGRSAGKVWTGQLNAGDNYVMPNMSSLPAGQYIMHLNVIGIGTLDQKITILK